MSRACRQLEPLLHDYAEGWLPERERTRVQRHLERCIACQQRLQAWRAVGDTLRSLPRLPAPTPAPAPVSEPEPRFALRLALALCLPAALILTAYCHHWQPPALELLDPYEPLLHLAEQAQQRLLTLWSGLRGIL